MRETEIEIRIRGRLSESMLAALPNLHAETQPVATVLCGEVQDSAALHGLIERIRSLGLELIEVRRVPD
jgi:hypothetical protein